MAEVADDAPLTDPELALSQGKRHLLVMDYAMAVTALGRACELLARKHGDTADELGEPYVFYGQALLGLAREEAGVLGGGVPGSEDADPDADDEDEDVDEEEDAQDAQEEESGKVEAKESDKDPEKKSANENEKLDSQESSAPERTTEDEAKATKSDIKGSEVVANGLDGAASTSGSSPKKNGGKEDETEDGDEEDEDEDDVNNLQLAWEVLELAKLVLVKRGPPGLKPLAAAHRLLGEVAMESGNHLGALAELRECLKILEKLEPRDSGAIAEAHYQLGLIHSLGNEFDSSIEQFNRATVLLQERIEELEKTSEPPAPTDNPFYTVEGEIKEMRELLPEIREKIADMKDFKQEACRLLIEGIKNKVGSGAADQDGSAGASGSGLASGSDQAKAKKEQKPVSDISHLVRKKRKAEDKEPEGAAEISPCKKLTPDRNGLN
ncbi:protein HGV2 [Orussus abietinus]|uniref:protein HGV2 n=1 Tax=Orussus abietinus TaxID=222816 RepID=UPI000626047D|nr:protein HGV2 [Orussus abietinus]